MSKLLNVDRFAKPSRGARVQQSRLFNDGSYSFRYITDDGKKLFIYYDYAVVSNKIDITFLTINRLTLTLRVQMKGLKIVFRYDT